MTVLWVIWMLFFDDDLLTSRSSGEILPRHCCGRCRDVNGSFRSCIFLCVEYPTLETDNGGGQMPGNPVL